MASLYQFSEAEILAFFLVMLRMSGFVVTWPIFGIRMVPTPSKVLFALVMSMVIFPVISWEGVEASLFSPDIIWLTLRELFIGLTFGYLSRLFFYALNIAGEIISVSMGISSAQLFNPIVGERTSATQQFLVAIGTLFFLAINGHHLFINGIVQSFTLIPLSPDAVSMAAFQGFGDVVSEIMAIGVQISAPILISILFMNLGMALIGRAVPQINVLITSLPVNIMVGFIVMIISVPLLITEMHDLLDFAAAKLFQIVKSF